MVGHRSAECSIYPDLVDADIRLFKGPATRRDAARGQQGQSVFQISEGLTAYEPDA